MPGLSSVYKNKSLDALFGNGTPSSFYIGLYTLEPDQDGQGGSEVVASDYARLIINNNSTYWPAAIGGVKSLGQQISFPMTANIWGTVRAIGLWVSLSSILAADYVTTVRLKSPIYMPAGFIPHFPAGIITVRSS